MTRTRAIAVLVLALGGACQADSLTAAGDTTSTSESETGSDDGGEFDPCPDPACLCFLPPVQVDFAPELADAEFDLDGDGWLDDITISIWSSESNPVFRAWLGTGPGVFEDEITYGPQMPEDYRTEAFTVSDVDRDGANDFVFLEEHGSVYVIPAAELWLDQLVEHATPIQYSPWWHGFVLAVDQLSDDPVESVFLLYEYGNLVEIMTYDPDTQRFEPRFLLGTDLRPTDLRLFDVDGDRDRDLVTVDSGAETLSVFVWDSGSFATPQRFAVPDLVEIDPLPARSYLLVHGGPDLWALRPTANGLTLDPVGSLLPHEFLYNQFGRVDPVADGQALLWLIGSASLYSLCADADGLWTRSALPLWDAGEDGAIGKWHYADQNADLRPDLSIREGQSGSDPALWRLLGQ